MNVLRDHMDGLGFSTYECALRNLVSLIEMFDRIEDLIRIDDVYDVEQIEAFEEEVQGCRTFTSICLQDLKRERDR